MFSTVVTVACLLGSAVAFVPTPVTRSSSMVMAAERSKSLPFLLKPVKLDGTLPGDEGFDPLGLSNIDDLGIDLYWMREAELKHSRIAMLAVVGAIAQELGFVVPGLVLFLLSDPVTTYVIPLRYTTMITAHRQEPSRTLLDLLGQKPRTYFRHCYIPQHS